MAGAAVLVLGGVAPLVLTFVALFALPESVRYMVVNNYPAERVRVILEPDLGLYLASGRLHSA